MSFETPPPSDASNEPVPPTPQGVPTPPPVPSPPPVPTRPPVPSPPMTPPTSSPPPPFGAPPGYGGPPSFGYGAGQPPNNYLVWAILTTILCCLPLGVVSIVFSSQVNSKWAMGDAQGALKASNNARNFAIASAVAVLVIGVVWLFFAILVGVSGSSSSSTTSL